MELFRSRTIEKKTDILLLEVVHTHKEREMLVRKLRYLFILTAMLYLRHLCNRLTKHVCIRKNNTDTAFHIVLTSHVV